MDLWPHGVESESLVDLLASVHSERHTGDWAARTGLGTTNSVNTVVSRHGKAMDMV